MFIGKTKQLKKSKERIIKAIELLKELEQKNINLLEYKVDGITKKSFDTLKLLHENIFQKIFFTENKKEHTIEILSELRKNIATLEIINNRIIEYSIVSDNADMYNLTSSIAKILKGENNGVAQYTR